MNLCVCKGSVYELCLHIWIFAYICGSVCISWCVDLHVWGVCVVFCVEGRTYEGMERSLD